MDTRPCRQENCTFADTGTCLLGYSQETCPERVELPPLQQEETAGDPVLAPPPPNPRFTSSQSMGATDLDTLMRQRVCRVIGVLGTPNSGKTAALASLYLLLSHAKLTGYEFADSRTLMAFEEISKGARRWNSAVPPEQMTSHTHLSDERSAGFLHLRLRESARANTVDYILPDLPGEWTDALIDSDRVDRWSFLRSADVIWIMVDGAKLRDATTSRLALHRTHLVFQRLKSMFNGSLPPIVVVATRLDSGAVQEHVVNELKRKAEQLGLSLWVHGIASFAEPEAPHVPGAGLADLIQLTSTLSIPSEASPKADVHHSREILNFRLRDGAAT